MMPEPNWAVPKLACDCHMHVFGPPTVYKSSQTRAYTPTERGLELYEKVAAGLGFGRVVFVQPSAYGCDNACMLAAMRTDPSRFRGVAVIDAAISEETLHDLHAAGVRGVRLNLVTEGEPDISVIRSEIERVVDRIAPLGWHIQFYAGMRLLGELAPLLRALAVPVVFDHMAGALSAGGLDQPGFDNILKMLTDSACWIKLSGADRVSESDSEFEFALPYAQALIAANPGRVVWGSDWPHLGHHAGPRGEAAMPAIYRDLNDDALLAVLRRAAPTERIWQRILVDNPAELYGF